MTRTAQASAVRRLDHLANLDHLTAHDVLELVRSAAWPSVTILLDTTPSERMTTADAARLHDLVAEAERQLAARSVMGAGALLTELRLLADTASMSPTGMGVALFAGRAVQRCYRLPEPVEAAVVVEDTFRTRDLLRTLHRTPPHLLLVMRGTMTQLYRAYADTLLPLPSPDFPLQLAVPVLGRLEGGDEVLDEFVRRVDRALGRARRRHPAPIIVAGDAEPVQRLLRRGRNLDRLAGVLTGPEVADPRALHLAAREQLEEYLRFRQDEALLLLEQARRTQPDTLVTGVEAAWHAMRTGALPLMLVVEESFRFPAVVDEESIRRLDWLHAPEMAPRGSHTDLVDDLIELVIDHGGWVAFADDDQLRSDGRVALVTTED
jgi:hypothetical protein